MVRALPRKLTLVTNQVQAANLTYMPEARGFVFLVAIVGLVVATFSPADSPVA
jgi:hypothetical protein